MNLKERAQVLVPRNNPVKRFLDYGIVPKKKYTVDVYFEIAELFNAGKSPEETVDYLHKHYPSLRKARISRPFVKNALRLTTALLLPEIVRLLPEGEWSLMIDGTVRSKDGNVLVIMAAVPLQPKEGEPAIIPLEAVFLPSENTKDIKNLLYELKSKLPSLPKSIISDFRAGIIEAVGKIFPDSIKHGCHYHIIEMIARTMINPLIRKINKILNPVASGLIRWAHHSIYGKQSEALVLVAKSIKKVCTSNGGNFGNNFLTFCKQMKKLIEWAHEREKYLKSSDQFKDLVKLLVDDIWTPLKPFISQLQEVLRQFNRLRKNLTMQEYKTDIGVIANDNPYPDNTMQLDLLINEWTKLGKIGENKYNERFGKAAERLKNHYDLITPPIIDHSLPRTTSILENLFSKIKQHLRRWSGTSRILRSFEWAAQLIAISQSLKETDLFIDYLRDVTAYNWVNETVKLSKNLSKQRFQTRFANSVANKSPAGLVSIIDNLVMREIVS